ncbi:hypothetical protein V5E97_11450 [Singulisphaera sp. Ch08]|uniref:ATP-binding protein n=1 Tax=Singulisphaera sp. Ch08 TaxID=3120278 RepID=A0AAU7CM62_9BACT
MTPIEARACIERLARRYHDRRERDPELYQSYTDMLKMLSEEIYSQDSHFVYELIQNAEDNSYPEGLGDRFVHFVLDGHDIVVRNNETGFSPANVEAICAVARSTKVDRTRGYVGEKGIGFKSVFKVTARPQVYSGAFHFQFDDESFVVPSWCEPAAGLSIDPATTTIVLPLRPALRDDLEHSLWSDFRELPGETLLFLKTLNRIVVEDRVSGAVRRLQRSASQNGVIQIVDGDKTTGWLVHRHDAQVPADLVEKKRQGVQVRELVFAFHADEHGHCLRLSDAFIYAFLPTGLKPGLPFLVQADFLTTANRESIHGDSAWNKWLRDQLPPAYLAAVKHGVRTSESFRLSFLQTLPLPDEISTGFFKPVANRILAAIAREPVFPGESGRLRPLGEVFRADERLRRLFPPSALAELLGSDVEYLDFRFQVPAAVAQWLDIPDAQTLLGSLLARHDWLSGRDDDWFIDLYGYLNDYPDLFDEDTLKSLPIIRLEGGRLVAAGEETVYLPPSEERVVESYGLKRFTFRIVSHAIIRRNPSPRKEEEKRLNHRTQAARTFLLERLEIKHHRPLEIVWNQVLPYLEDQTYESIEGLQADFGLLLYIKEHWSQIQKDADETEMDVTAAFRSLPVPASGPRKKRTVKGVREAYLPAELGGNPTFARLFQGVPDVWFIDADLLVEWDGTRKKRERKLKEWQGFLTDLGAPRSLQLIRRSWLLPQEFEVKIPDVFGPSDKLTKVTNYLKIADLIKLFEYLADKVKSTRDDRGRLLLKLLDGQWGEWETRFGGTAAAKAPLWWQSTYHHYSKWKRSGREDTKVLPCEFVQLLHSEAWVPVRGDGQPRRPDDVWLSNDDGGLGFSSGRCLAIPLENEGLIQALGLRIRLSVDELLVELDARIERGDFNLNGYRELYGLLATAWQEEGHGASLIAKFKSSRFIFLPHRPEFPFAASDDLVWKAPKGRIPRGTPAIEPFYPSLKDFFLRLEVAEQATPKFAIETLRQVAQIYDNEEFAFTQSLERARIWEAYLTLTEADFARDGGSEALQDFLEEGSLLGHDFEFYSCAELVAPDDHELTALFRKEGAATFLWLPEGHAEPEVARAVAHLFGLPRVSEAPRSVTFDEVAAGPACVRIASRFQAIRRDLLGYIRRVARSRFDALVESGQATALAGAPIRFASSIRVRYTLGERTITDPREPALAIDAEGIVLRADRCETLLDLGNDLESVLGVPGLAYAFYTLITVPNEQRAAHAERQGYLVPEDEWNHLHNGPAHPVVEELPDDSEEGGTVTSNPEPAEDKTHESDRPGAGRSSDPAERAPGDARSNGRRRGTDPVRNNGEDIDDGSPVPDKGLRPRSGRPREWTPPAVGLAYRGPTRFRSPRGSNARLTERLGTAPRRREVQEYLEGCEEPPAPISESDEAISNRIRTALYAVNLEHGFLRFAPADLRLFEPEWPAEFELIDDDGERVLVAIDYRAGIVHGKGLTAFLEARHDWPYGTVLSLDATSDPWCYHLHAEFLEEPIDIGTVEFFDFDDDGFPVVLTCHPKPFTVAFDEKVYRQERRWENRRAYNTLVAARGTGVLTEVYETLEDSTAPATAAEIHRSLLKSGRPCSYFSVLATLYGFACFEPTDDRRWRLVPDEASELRAGYRALLVVDSTSVPDPDRPSPDDTWNAESAPARCPLEPHEVTQLTEKLEMLAQPDPSLWHDAIDDLIEELSELKVIYRLGKVIEPVAGAPSEKGFVDRPCLRN